MPNYEAYLTLAKITLCVLAAIGCVLVLLMFFLVVLKSVSANSASRLLIC